MSNLDRQIYLYLLLVRGIRYMLPQLKEKKLKAVSRSEDALKFKEHLIWEK